MHDVMQKITSVPGIIGAVLFDESGACIAQDLKPPYEVILFTELLVQFQDVYDNHLALSEFDTINSVITTFDGGHLVVRRHYDMILMVLATESSNLAMLGVSMNVALLKLSRSGGQGAPTALGSSVSSSRQPQGYNSAVPPPVPPAARASAPQIPTNQSYGNQNYGNQGYGNQSYGGSGQSSRPSASGTADGRMSISWTAEPSGGRPPRDAVGLGVMRHVLKALARRIGPAEARSILDAELRNMGATPSTVRASEFTDMLHNVANRMANRADREAFIADALGDMG
ncbi:hypothetical protein [Haliangium ochraceum]|uniref:Roadblock/LC7 family protein n=1 Tax=Haliangium ochraceum (strain DSM 14365 / JCM 11303 / SMP-2) TaxID=502025 RepID=D0LRP2_HALO1|nr:hypothetical protein [Haliangium ochraceum]ACY19034.1 hypothetical protein Hoch_6566 [Haliangium ochraceum DSM 14365]